MRTWLDAYVEAWRSYDPAASADLFTEDATHAYHPWDEAVATGTTRYAEGETCYNLWVLRFAEGRRCAEFVV